MKGEIANLSQGGTFLITTENLQKGDVVSMAFGVFQQSCVISAKVVHCKKDPPRGFGMQFEHTSQSKVVIRQIINTLVSEGVKPRQYREREFFNEFILWGLTLIRTGKGWVPEIPIPPSQTPLNVIAQIPQSIGKNKKSKNKTRKIKKLQNK